MALSTKLFSTAKYMTTSTAVQRYTTPVNTLMNTYKKVFELPEDGKITRHNFVKLASSTRTSLEKLNRIEAFYAYAGLMNVADGYGLTKFPEDGGNTYTIAEMCEVLQTVPKKELAFNVTAFSRALFRAIDTDASGFISRDEWIVHLKARNSYESDEQALRSFDSLDTNKDGQISMQEYEQGAIKFWTSSGTNQAVEDIYGTRN